MKGAFKVTDTYALTRGQMRPLINLNGTTREALVEQRTVVLASLWKAIEDMREHVPHGRDYQGYKDDMQYTRDRALWELRMSRLVDLREEIMAEAVAIQEGSF